MLCIAREYSYIRLQESTIQMLTHLLDQTDRLRTILYYDRVLVMSAGEIAEFDTPENLFLQGGAFAEMCEKSNIDLNEIRQAALLRN